MTTLILGARGMLGRALTREFPEAAAVDLAELDIRVEADVRVGVIPGVSLVLNAAADTDVDRAEGDPSHFETNDKAVGRLASRCLEVGARLVHVSTDYVFDGRGARPYLEDDPVAPVNAYGLGKLGSERRALDSGAEALVVRTSWVFGAGGRNFVDAILRQAEAGQTSLKVVSDQTGRPTYSRDLARAIRLLTDRRATGLVHFANAGPTTWFAFAREILARAGFGGIAVEPCATSEFPRRAPRPPFSVLDTGRYERLVGEPPRPWKDALADHLAERRGSSAAVA